MRRSTMRFLVGMALLMILLPSLPLKGQTSERVYECFVTTPAFQEAQLLLLQGAEEGDIERAVEKFGQIGAQNPGTTLGAVALLQQALYSDPARRAGVVRQPLATPSLGGRWRAPRSEPRRDRPPRGRCEFSASLRKCPDQAGILPLRLEFLSLENKVS